MLARLRKAQEEHEGGFTLIELLVVMIIIGILAAIAIPAFLSQRSKARDTAAKSDATVIGKELASYFVDGTAHVYATGSSGTWNIYAKGTTTSPLASGRLSDGDVVNGATSYGLDDSDWCVEVTNSKSSSSTKTWKYSAANGLQQGLCTVPLSY